MASIYFPDEFNLTVAKKEVEVEFLSEEEKEMLYELTETNMRILHIACGEHWNKRSKKVEMFKRGDKKRALMVGRRGALEMMSVIAFVIFGEVNGELFIFEIQVQKAMRGFGLGKNLLGHVEARSKEWKLDIVSLSTLLTNTAANSWYSRFGFQDLALSGEQRKNMYKCLSWSVPLNRLPLYTHSVRPRLTCRRNGCQTLGSICCLRCSTGDVFLATSSGGIFVLCNSHLNHNHFQ